MCTLQIFLQYIPLTNAEIIFGAKDIVCQFYRLHKKKLFFELWSLLSGYSLEKQDYEFGIPNSELQPLESPWQFHE